jgi:hypothetical protein
MHTGVELLRARNVLYAPPVGVLGVLIRVLGVLTRLLGLPRSCTRGVASKCRYGQRFIHTYERMNTKL